MVDQSLQDNTTIRDDSARRLEAPPAEAASLNVSFSCHDAFELDSAEEHHTGNPSPSHTIQTSPQAAEKKKRSIWSQVKSGSLFAGRWVGRLWALLWLGAWVVNASMVFFGIVPYPARSPVRDPAPRSDHMRSMNENTSEAVVSAFALSGEVPADAQIWAELGAFRKILDEASPELSRWLSSEHKKGTLHFRREEYEGRKSRDVEFLSLSRDLNIYPSFFSCSDGMKILIIAHENTHYKQTMAEWIYADLRPHVITGLFAGAVGTLAGGVLEYSGDLASNLSLSALPLDVRNYIYEKEAEGQMAEPGRIEFGQFDSLGWATRRVTIPLFICCRSASKWGYRIKEASSDSGWPIAWSYGMNECEMEAYNVDRETAQKLGLLTWDFVNYKDLQSDFTSIPTKDPLVFSLQEPAGLTIVVISGAAGVLRKKKKKQQKPETAQRAAINSGE